MKDLEKKNYYELLRVDSSASEEEIKIAFKEIALVYHPDSNFFSEIVSDDNLSESDINMFKAITIAYQTLSNKQKRADYDAKLTKEKISKGVSQTNDWIRPDGKSAPISSKPRERAPTVTDLQNLQKRYQERSQVKMKSVAEIMEDGTSEKTTTNYQLIIGSVFLVIVIVVIITLLV